jgi:hypothetical protein
MPANALHNYKEKAHSKRAFIKFYVEYYALYLKVMLLIWQVVFSWIF